MLEELKYTAELIQKLYTNYAKDSSQRKVKEYLQKREEQLEGYWTKFNELAEQSSDAEVTEIQATTTRYYKALSIDIRSRLEEFRAKAATPESTPATAQDSVSHTEEKSLSASAETTDPATDPVSQANTEQGHLSTPVSTAVQTIENEVNHNIMSKLDVSFALKFIPEFDATKATCSVSQFIACCDTVYNLTVETDRDNFVNLLHTKLRGKAYSILEYNPTFKWTEIKKELKKLFLENRTYEGILSELLNCKQNTDTVVTFANKVEKLLSDLNSACVQLLGDANAVHVRILNERIALKGFEDGLKSGLKLLVKARAYKTLHDATTYAIIEDKQYVESHSKYSNNTNVPHATKKFNSSNSSNSSPNTPNRADIKKEPKASFQGTKLFCSYCKKKGHTLEKCRKAPQNKPTSSGNASGQNTADSSVPASNLE